MDVLRSLLLVLALALASLYWGLGTLATLLVMSFSATLLRPWGARKQFPAVLDKEEEACVDLLMQASPPLVQEERRRIASVLEQVGR
jgi:hypothetical protein